MSIAWDLFHEGGDAWFVLEDLAQERGWTALANMVHALLVHTDIVLSFIKLVRETPSDAVVSAAGRAVKRAGGASGENYNMMLESYRAAVAATRPSIKNLRSSDVLVFARKIHDVLPSSFNCWREELLQQIQDIIELDPRYNP